MAGEVLSKENIEWALANMRMLDQKDPRIKSHTIALESAAAYLLRAEAAEREVERLKGWMKAAFEYHYLPTVEKESWVDECAYGFCENIGMERADFDRLNIAADAEEGGT